MTDDKDIHDEIEKLAKYFEECYKKDRDSYRRGAEAIIAQVQKFAKDLKVVGDLPDNPGSSKENNETSELDYYKEQYVRDQKEIARLKQQIILLKDGSYHDALVKHGRDLESSFKRLNVNKGDWAKFYTIRKNDTIPEWPDGSIGEVYICDILINQGGIPAWPGDAVAILSGIIHNFSKRVEELTPVTDKNQISFEFPLHVMGWHDIKAAFTIINGKTTDYVQGGYIQNVKVTFPTKEPLGPSDVITAKIDTTNNDENAYWLYEYQKALVDVCFLVQSGLSEKAVKEINNLKDRYYNRDKKDG